MDSLINERKKKYDGCLKSYQKYINKETELLKRNQAHSSMRNKYYEE